MPDTTRVRSGFDLEVQLGGGWFQVALQALADTGQLIQGPLPQPFPPNPTIAINDVEIIFDQGDWDLAIDLTADGIPLSPLASLELNEDGTELAITTNLPGANITVPFDVLDGLAGPPELRKVPAEDGNEAAIAVLANLDLRASPQGGEPRAAGDHVPRGAPLLAQSFLPQGKALAIGVGQATWERFANDMWHTQLRASDGSHPLPDEDHKKGDWHAVSITPHNGKVRATLVGEVPIDIWPDATVTIEIEMTPKLVDGALTFELSVDSDVDTGILGDILAFLVGGLIGLVVGLLLGGLSGGLIGAGIGAVGGVVVLEVVEYVVEQEVKKQIRARLDGDVVTAYLSCRNNVVMIGTPDPEEDGLTVGPLNAVPRSILIATDRPDELHERHTLIMSSFDELTMDASGLAVAGTASPGELFVPLSAALVDCERDPAVDGEPGNLRRLVYRASDNSLMALELAEATDRAVEGELNVPFKVSPSGEDDDFRMPGGRLPTVCLEPTNIRRKDTIITDIRFTTGLELRVPEAVGLQDAGVLILPGLQLIHPENANPYFRAPADSTEENNFENLPPF